MIVCFFLMSFIEISGGKYTNTQSGNELVVQGTSSLHDWEMKAEVYQCTIEVNWAADQLQFSKVNLAVKATGITEGNKVMEKKAHGALKADEFPNIKFQLTSPFEAPLNDEHFSGVAQGNLTIAGTTKNVVVDFTGKILSTDQFEISGSRKLKMSDFNISPPTAMMGTLKTGDEITISFHIKYSKTN